MAFKLQFLLKCSYLRYKERAANMVIKGILYPWKIAILLSAVQSND